MPIEDVYKQIAEFAREGGARRVTLFGSRARGTNLPKSDIIKGSYALYDFVDETTWLSMLRDRNTIMRIYDEAKELELVNAIIEDYIPAFQRLKEGLDARYGELLLAKG
ncbi:MAG: nucleotidyltransferase substrate binding protein [Coriobacteriia bacterium]|nr:nucleotidyltransferase substrate binding protein [Coriobacteriia bacterium]